MATVMVADDSWLSRQMIIKILERAGYETAEAIDGRVALEKIEAQPPDLLVLDILMPGLDGFGVLKGLREMHADVPTIVMSASIQETAREKCRELGALCVLNKPPNEEQLLLKVQETLGRARKTES